MALKWIVNSAFTQPFSQSSSAVCNQVSMPLPSETQKVAAVMAAWPTSSDEVKEEMMMSSSKKNKADDDQNINGGFQMPLHYPTYTKPDYEKMEEWKLDLLLKQYGLPLPHKLQDKRAFAMGAFLWPHQL